MIELYIGNKAVDVSPDTNITLNFNGNLFGDISEITASNSFTIYLPKTSNNNRIFRMPSAVGGSRTPYQRWDASLYINGVTVIEMAYATLLSVSENYEIVLYWGVVTQLSTLKDNDKTIAEIDEILQIQYGGAEWWKDWNTKIGTTLQGVGSGNIVNALYESGIEDLPNNATAREEVALLPCVRASWVWDNIIKDNDLTINAPSGLRSWLNCVALPFTGHKTAPVDSFGLVFTKSNIRYYKPDDYGAITFHTPKSTPTSANYTIQNKEIPYIFAGSTTKFDSTIISSQEDGVIDIKYHGNGTYRGDMNVKFFIERRGEEHNTLESVSKNIILMNNGTFDFDISFVTNIREGEYIVAYLQWFDRYYNNNVDGVKVLNASADVRTTYEDVIDQAMGGMINTRYNLPHIKQLDFIKCVIAMRGLWATLVDGEVHLQSIADFYEDSGSMLDWSSKLVGSGEYDALNTTYTLEGYAQRNILQYKEDDTVNNTARGDIIVDNETLDKEKAFYTSPFSASDGNKMIHLKLEDGEVKSDKLSPRIMLLSELHNVDGKVHASIDFDHDLRGVYGSLDFDCILSENYKDWQKVVRNPIVIEEHVNLNEIDIKNLDFRIPVYLAKYAAVFAVKSVQWREDEPSSVVFVKLPPKMEIADASSSID